MAQLKELISEAKKAGKDVSKLEALLEKKSAPQALRGGKKQKGAKAPKAKKPPMGKTKRIETEDGIRVIESTGPAREEDFDA